MRARTLVDRTASNDSSTKKTRHDATSRSPVTTVRIKKALEPGRKPLLAKTMPSIRIRLDATRKVLS
jgi:hypothetical protein